MILLMKKPAIEMSERKRANRVARRGARGLLHLVIVIALLVSSSSSLFAQRKAATRPPSSLEQVAPETVGMSGERLARIDEAVQAAIERKDTPGAVVLVGRKGRIVYRKAFGDRAIEPQRETMTVDTIFDLASLT